MRPRQITPLRKVKEEDMTSVALESQTVTAEYNGWTNSETWLVNLWMANNERYYNQLCAIVSSGDSLNDRAKTLADWLRSQYDGEYSSIWADYIGQSLTRVNWCEIVEMNQE